MTLQAQQTFGTVGWEELSALLDGELDDDEGRRTLERIVRDPGLAGRWSEYSLIGDILRGCQDGCPELGRRIHYAMENEPTVLAPLRQHKPQRPALWLAAAAAVAAVSWSLWSYLPTEGLTVQTVNARAVPVEREVMHYLAAHQDYSQAVISTPEMRLTPVVLANMGGGQ